MKRLRLRRGVTLADHPAADPTGYDWVYVLNGTLRLVLGEHDLILGPGEAAEFDTRTPHWFGATGAAMAPAGSVSP